MYLLDTEVVSQLNGSLRRDDGARVTAWLAQMDPSACFLSTLGLMELEVGVLRLERQNAVEAASVRAWLERQLVPAFGGRMLAVDEAVARRAARIHLSSPRPQRDALIAATAMVNGLTLATRNVADFAATGVSLFDPWQSWVLQETEPRRYVARG